MSARARKIDEYGRELLSWGWLVRPERLDFMLADCKRMLRQGADDLGSVHATMGHIYARQGNAEKSEHHYRNAVHYAPTFTPYKICLGASLLNTGQPLKALELLAETADDKNLADYDKVIAYANAAEALAALGQTHEAHAVMQEAIDLADHSSAQHVIVLATQSAELGSDWEATELFARFCALEQGIPRGAAPAVDVIKNAPELVREVLNAPYGRRLGEAVRKVIEYGADCAPVSNREYRLPADFGGASESEALAVFYDMAPLREDANLEVLSVDRHG